MRSTSVVVAIVALIELVVLAGLIGGMISTQAKVASVETQLVTQSSTLYAVMGTLKGHQEVLDKVVQPKLNELNTVQPQLNALATGLRSTMGDKAWTKFAQSLTPKAPAAQQ